jgi:tetratricopeptide (TPR) repeat protein
MAMESAENWTLQLLREVSSRGAYGRSQTEPPGRGGRSVHLLPVAAAWARGDRDEAEKLLRAVLDKSPSDGEGWQYLAFMMHEQGKSKLAIEALRRACEAQPASSKAHYLLGTELLDAGSDEEAVRELREAVRLDDKSSDAHYGLGYALSRTARYVDAVAEYKRVLEIDPSYVAARTGLEYAEGMLRAGH